LHNDRLRLSVDTNYVSLLLFVKHNPGVLPVRLLSINQISTMERIGIDAFCIYNGHQFFLWTSFIAVKTILP